MTDCRGGKKQKGMKNCEKGGMEKENDRKGDGYKVRGKSV